MEKLSCKLKLNRWYKIYHYIILYITFSSISKDEVVIQGVSETKKPSRMFRKDWILFSELF